VGWLRRGAVIVVSAVLVVTFFPGSPGAQFAEACPPDGNAPITNPSPAASPTATAKPRRPLPRAFQPDAASKNPRTFGRQAGHIYVADPVDVVTGAYSFATTDLVVPSRGLDFRFARTYNSADDYWPSTTGPGWVHTYDWEIQGNNNQPTVPTIISRGDERRGVQADDISFTANPDFTFTLVTHDHTVYTFGQRWDRDTGASGPSSRS